MRKRIKCFGCGRWTWDIVPIIRGTQKERYEVRCKNRICKYWGIGVVYTKDVNF